MIKQFASAALVLGLLCTAKPAAAANEDLQFAVEGAGRLDCTVYIAARKDRGSAEFQRLIGFVEGYLSAANRYEPNTFDLSPWHNAAAFDLILESHCTENPKDGLISVLQRMVTGFRPIRVARYSPLLEVGDADGHVYVYETVIRRAQSALHMRGLYNGQEDGKFSPELKLAIAAFQKSTELRATGLPDSATLWTLLNP